MKKPRLVAHLVLTVAMMASASLSTPTYAGMPVIDGANLIENIESTLHAVIQTNRQLEQYQNQVARYKIMAKNATRPDQNVWNNSQSLMQNLLSVQNSLDYYKRELGGITQYMNQYQDVMHYRNTPCFNGSGCTASDKAAIEKNIQLASESQKKANDALFQSIDKQQDELNADADKLEQLQAHAHGVDGHLEAIGYANQLASAQSHQLLQIRAMLLAQQNALAAKTAAEQDQAARDRAMEELMTDSSYTMPPSQTFYWRK